MIDSLILSCLIYENLFNVNAKVRCLIGREKLVAYDWLMPAKERMLENFNIQIYAQNEKIVLTESQEDISFDFTLPGIIEST